MIAVFRSKQRRVRLSRKSSQAIHQVQGSQSEVLQYLLKNLLELHQASKKQADFLEFLNHVGQRFAANLSLQDLFRSIYTEVRHIMTADVFFVALYDEVKEEVELRYIYENGEELAPVKFQLNEGPTSRVIKSRLPLMYVTDGTLPAGATRFGSPRNSTRSIMTVPIILQNRVLGALSVQAYAPNAHTDADLQMLNTLANQASIALENAKLYGQTLDMALTDGMTGLKNRRAFYESLDLSLATATAEGHPLSLLMVDSDSLKQINDLYGHGAGDDYIVHLARVIGDCVHPQDVVARFGGDEFMIIAPETDIQGAKLMANAIVERIRGADWSVAGQRVGATVSVGVATFPQDAASRDELIRAADVAMYRAKRSGKNRFAATADINTNG